MLTRDGRRRADPAYTPDIGHLVHRSEARVKSARARLAEVLSLTRTATKLRQAAHRKAAERGASPREQQQPQYAASTGRGGGHVTVVHVRSTSEPWERRQPSRELSIGGTDCGRELSPVRWCDREVDGVFLGRSGWVQVQAPQRVRMVNYHSPRSEPLPSPQRPGYLPLPTSLDLSSSLSTSTPPATPILSPPPAFQDIKRSPRRMGLSRADAIESPPPSPPRSRPSQFKSLEESRRSYRDSSSSSSSFGFRSLDYPRLDASRVMPRLTEVDPPLPPIIRPKPRLSETTDSSLGYDESDYSTVTLINSPGVFDRIPAFDRILPPPERISPSRGRQRLRRSPGSEKNGAGGSPSSSSSCSPPPRRTGAPPPVNCRSYDCVNRSNRVRRSRSLQLPERRSPNIPTPELHYHEPLRTGRPPMYNRSTQSEEAVLRREAAEVEALRREAEEEARLVTEFIQSARSREAARNLIRSRLGGTSEYGQLPVVQQQPTPAQQDYNVVLVRRRGLPRLATAPSGPHPCNPSSCDFWPHCAHRDGIYASRVTTPLGSSQPTPPSSMRLSQSYPNQVKKEPSGYATRSSPASLERVDTSPRPRRGASLNLPDSRYRRSPEKYEEVPYKRDNTPLTSHKTDMMLHRGEATSFESDWRSSSGRWGHERPGSAPAAHAHTARLTESAQRSLSLPKCFQAGRELPKPPRNVYGGAQWPRRPGPLLRPPTPEVTRTAPPTPVRELTGSKCGSLQGSGRFCSTPLLDPQPSGWDLPGDWTEVVDSNLVNGRAHRFTQPKEVNHSRRNISESVLQKFRKSFSLRFHKKDGGEDSPPEDLPIPAKDENHINEKFRFGPLVWRSSKERKKRAARSAKCNSGDSGIQVEMVGSSESHDTDQPPEDEFDSPPLVRRRGRASSSEGRVTRPSSEVINQLLIDRLKSELQTRKTGVRRTHSDLGGRRLYQWEGARRGYKRMVSHPPPIGTRPSRPAFRGSRHSRRCMRRSVSQPLGLNNLSPLVTRKTVNRVASEDERGGATSDDEALSDSESSVASLNERKKSFEQMWRGCRVVAEAVWDHVAMETEELGFRAGDIVEVIDSIDRDWWWGESGGKQGWFPSLFVRLKVGQHTNENSSTSKQLSESQVRGRVVMELVNTERDFVKVLRDLTEGYLEEARRRGDLLTEDETRRIFSNLEEIRRFQEGFLSDLESCVDWDEASRSRMAPAFLKHLSGFRSYSEYCNSYPTAVSTLEEVFRRPGVQVLLESIRLQRGMMELPLSGYLLTPVQRICKYPLQLAELLKYTKTDHEDYEDIQKSVEGMRGVAHLINERKRRMESLEKLALWQDRVENWEGEDLTQTSSQLIHQGEAVRITSGIWSHNVTLFLFDHQLVYCKKDILKRHTYVYKGRISLDTCEVIDLPDGKDPELGCTIRHGLKLSTPGKWLVFTVRSAADKAGWMGALAKEREVSQGTALKIVPHSSPHQDKRYKRPKRERWLRLGRPTHPP